MLDKAWKWVLRICVLIFILFFVFSILLQFQPVQNFVASTITKRLSKKLDAQVEIGAVKLSITKGVYLENLLLAQEGDTVIYAGRFSSSLDNNLLSALSNDIYLDELNLEDCMIRITTEKGDTKSNMVKLLEKLSGNEKQTGSSEPLSIDLNRLYLKNADVRIEDYNDLSKKHIRLTEGDVKIRDIKPEENIFDIQSIHLVEPEIVLQDGTVALTNIETKSDDNDNVSPKPLHVILQKLSIEDGKVDIIDPKVKSRSSAFSTDNFKVDDLHINISDVRYTSSFPLSLSINNAKLTLDDKLFVENLEAQDIYVDQTEIIFKGFNFNSRKSKISQDLTLSFDGFDNISEDVLSNKIDANFREISVDTDELLYMFPSLRDMKEININEVDKIECRGLVSGSGQNLLAKELELTLGDELDFYGVIHLQNLGYKGEERINMGIDSITTTVPSLRRIFPGINPPQNFNKLGNIIYKGRIDGYFTDLVSYGDLTSDIGHVDIDDMFINTKDGIDNASYSGKMFLQNFDLGYWSDNEDFDIVDLGVTVSDGYGLRQHNARADVMAELTSFSYKGYKYEGIQLKGEMDKNKFDGKLTSTDENLDFVFDGVYEFTDSMPKYIFTADIKKADLHALHLSEEPFFVSGKVDVDFHGSNINTLQGEGHATNLSIIDKDSTYQVDSVYLSSKMNPDNTFVFVLDSELIDANVEGSFDLRQMHMHVLKTFEKNYPYHYRQLNLPTVSDTLKNANFTFDINIDDSKNFLDLINAKGLRIENTKLVGNVNSTLDIVNADITSPAFEYKSFSLVNFHVTLENKANKGFASVQSDTTYINSNLIKPIKVTSGFIEDKINFSVATTELLDPNGRLSFSGSLMPHEIGYELNLEGDEIVMLGESWHFDNNNKVAFGNSQVQIDNFVLSDGFRNISIDDIEGAGLDIRTSNFDIDLINPIVDYDKLLFSGLGESHIQVNSIYKDPYVTGNIALDTFFINKDDFGKLTLE